MVPTLTDGIDFFFNTRADAKHFTEFLAAVAPVRYATRPWVTPQHKDI
jgi:hypothetical protein